MKFYLGQIWGNVVCFVMGHYYVDHSYFPEDAEINYCCIRCGRKE